LPARGIASVGASREALLLAIRMASDRLGKPGFAASSA
jgi:hypothetical protein